MSDKNKEAVDMRFDKGGYSMLIAIIRLCLFVEYPARVDLLVELNADYLL